MAKRESLGLLQLGARTTSFYLQSINAYYAKKYRNNVTPPLTVTPTNFDEINKYLPDQFDSLVRAIRPSIDLITSDRIIVPNITLHETLDAISVTNLVHPVRETIRKLKQLGHSRAMLLGSKYSMQAPYISDLMHTNGISIILPTEQDQDQLDICRRKVYDFQETIGDVKSYNSFINKQTQIMPIVIACTELSIVLRHTPNNLLDDNPLDNNVLDMARIQIQAALD